MIAQEGGSQMLDGMHFGSVHDRLLIGAGHAQVEGGDDLTAHSIPAGYIDSGLEPDMVNGEACDFFHNKFSLSEGGGCGGAGCAVPPQPFSFTGL